MMWLTARAAVTNINATYFMPSFLVLGAVIALVTRDATPLTADLLMSFGFVLSFSIALLVGTTLAEIKVKPLSFALPGQETSMAPAALVVGVVICLGLAALVLARPMSAGDVPAMGQALAVFGYGLGVFMLFVTVCVMTRDTAYTSLAGALAFMLVFGALGNPTLREAWITINVALSSHPVLGLSVGALGTGAAFYVLGNRNVSRNVCGSPFLPLKAYDNPFRLDAFRSRMEGGAFRRSPLTSSGGGPGSLLLAALSRRFAGTSLDYLVLETRVSRNIWEFLLRLAYTVLIVGMIGFMGNRASSQDNDHALGMLLISVAVFFLYFPPTFKTRLSPMLPVARRRRFLSFFIKAVSLYGLTLVALTMLRVALEALLTALPQAASPTLQELAGMPFKGILIVAAIIPVFCWAFTALRSTIAFLAFMIVFLGVGVNVAAFASERLLALGFNEILLATAVLWLPFVAIAWKRCFKDDLLLP
jgi:hypothetical protein